MRTIKPSQGLQTVALFAFIGAATPVAAQGRGDEQAWLVQRRNDSRLARQVLVHGQPANRRDWALGQINSCGALGGESLAAAIPRYRTVSAPGGEMEKLVQSAAYLTDGNIFNAALALAADESAAGAARIQAIRIAYHQLNPAVYQSYEAFLTDSWETGIVHVGSITSEAPPQGTPLPGDALERAIRVLQRILATPSAPVPVRQAATYLRDDVEWKQLRLRVCGADAPPAACDRLLDEWKAEEEPMN